MVLKSPEQRRAEAEARHEEFRSLTTEQKIQRVLDRSGGVENREVKRLRLQLEMEQKIKDEQNQKKEKVS